MNNYTFRSDHLITGHVKLKSQVVICLQIINNKAQRSFLVNSLEDWVLA